MRPSWFMLFFFMVFLFLGGCEIFSDHNSNNQFPLPPKPPVLEFSYTSSASFPGWIRFTNNCTSMASYKWYLGFIDESGMEALSFSAAPKVKYPFNGSYNVFIEGIDIYNNKHSMTLSVDVRNN